MPARCFIGYSSTNLLLLDSVFLTFPSVHSLSEVLVRLGREALCTVDGQQWNTYSCTWVQQCLLSLHLAMAASVSRNFQLCSCPQGWYCPQGKGGWLQCIGSSWMQRHLVNHLFLFPSFLPLVRAGEDILCFLASCLQSSSCLLTTDHVGYFVCNSLLAYS